MTTTTTAITTAVIMILLIVMMMMMMMMMMTLRSVILDFFYSPLTQAHEAAIECLKESRAMASWCEGTAQLLMSKSGNFVCF